MSNPGRRRRRVRRNPGEDKGTLYHGVAAARHTGRAVKGAYRGIKRRVDQARSAWRENPASGDELRQRWADRLEAMSPAERKREVYSKSYWQLINFLRWNDREFARNVDAAGVILEDGEKMAFDDVAWNVLNCF